LNLCLCLHFARLTKNKK